MAFQFNPFTGNFDVTGDGSITISGITPDAVGDLEDRDDYDVENEGFVFFAIDEGALYIRVGESGWSDAVMVRGMDGTDGRTILSGTADPTTEGEDGDFYINTDTSTLFGPKASGTWPSGVSLVGAPGAGTDITYDAPTREVRSSTGSDAVLPLVSTTNAGLMDPAQNDKLNIAVVSDVTGVTGADAVVNIISLTQAEYDAIVAPDAATLYVITD